MTHSKFGKMHICRECEAKFFDMGKELTTCPKCGKPLEVPTKPNKKATKAKPTASSFKSDVDFDDLDSINDDYDGEFDTELDGDFGDYKEEEESEDESEFD